MHIAEPTAEMYGEGRGNDTVMMAGTTRTVFPTLWILP